jgi:hypothetical protein
MMQLSKKIFKYFRFPLRWGLMLTTEATIADVQEKDDQAGGMGGMGM